MATSTLQIDLTTVLSLLGTLAVLATAYALSLRLLPRSSGPKARVLFVWHLFDALIHFVFEGSFLWNCFCVHWIPPPPPAAAAAPSPLSPYSIAAAAAHAAASNAHTTTPPPSSPTPQDFLILTPPDVFFLQRNDTLFGAAYGTGPFSRLWQEYAKADRRWGGADLTVVSIELLTVFLAGPLALWCAEQVRRGEWYAGRQGMEGRKWFWMVVLATGELYGGFMTFAPEWLSGSPNLDTSNFMFKWVYLFFFNTLWVWLPLWIMYEAYKGITSSLSQKEVVNVISYLEKKAD
ncbi:emopamil-binding protein [Diplodia corticola]|uniref:Emopamil-binding protein n=1 Tax=Diplodia corticola TaxID=236234 RepID=A0A1J9R6K6_9PEZI|nr:emopamil-binding protein [Diplodia corticola]OJD36169.1 emopamil-binding protein [Diplodia corticola]